MEPVEQEEAQKMKCFLGMPAESTTGDEIREIDQNQSLSQVQASQQRLDSHEGRSQEHMNQMHTASIDAPGSVDGMTTALHDG